MIERASDIDRLSMNEMWPLYRSRSEKNWGRSLQMTWVMVFSGCIVAYYDSFPYVKHISVYLGLALFATLSWIMSWIATDAGLRRELKAVCFGQPIKAKIEYVGDLFEWESRRGIAGMAAFVVCFCVDRSAAEDSVFRLLARSYNFFPELSVRKLRQFFKSMEGHELLLFKEDQSGLIAVYDPAWRDFMEQCGRSDLAFYADNSEFCANRSLPISYIQTVLIVDHKILDETKVREQRIRDITNKFE